MGNSGQKGIDAYFLRSYMMDLIDAEKSLALMYRCKETFRGDKELIELINRVISGEYGGILWLREKIKELSE